MRGKIRIYNKKQIVVLRIKDEQAEKFMVNNCDNGSVEKSIEQIDYRARMIALYQSSEYQKLSAYYAKKSFFSILGIARREDQHSNMIAWLLNPRGEHGFGKNPLRRFLQLLAVAKMSYASNRESDFPDAILDTFITGSFDIVDGKVEREVTIPEGRLDLLLSINLVCGEEKKILPVIIENKVESVEHSEQTKTYHDWAIKEYADRENYYQPVCVFLTPDGSYELETGRGDVTPCSCAEALRINYQGIVDHVITPCLKEDSPDDTRCFIRDYLRCLSFEALAYDERENSMTMAYSEEEKNLLHAFWETNKDLLKAAMFALSEDASSGLEEEDRKRMRALAQKLPSSKDYTKYQIGADNTPLGKGRMVFEVVKRYVEDRSVFTFSELQEAFPDELAGSTRTYGVVRKLTQEIKEQPYKRYFINDNDMIRLGDGTVVVVSKEWGRDNISGFIGYVNEKFHFGIREIQADNS